MSVSPLPVVSENETPPSLDGRFGAKANYCVGVVVVLALVAVLVVAVRFFLR